MYRSFISGIVASTLGVVSTVPVTGHPLCRPTLTVTDIQFSEMIPPTLERKWTAVVSDDASHCMTTSGTYEIAFSRLKENAPDIDFQRQFTWHSPFVQVSVDFWADEAVERYWLNNIASCPCRN